MGGISIDHGFHKTMKEVEEKLSKTLVKNHFCHESFLLTPNAFGGYDLREVEPPAPRRQSIFIPWKED